jgi:hypothetical protein
MALIDISLPKSIARALRLPTNSAKRQQMRVLKKLLKKARFTEFGQKFRFDEILLSNHPGKKFQQFVPTYNYNKIYKDWWHKSIEGQTRYLLARESKILRTFIRNFGSGQQIHSYYQRFIKRATEL